MGNKKINMQNLKTVERIISPFQKFFLPSSGITAAILVLMPGRAFLCSVLTNSYSIKSLFSARRNPFPYALLLKFHTFLHILVLVQLDSPSK